MSAHEKQRVKVEVISGPEGMCLAIGNENSLTRVAGPKPWGGGQTVYGFEVPLDRIQDALPKEAAA